MVRYSLNLKTDVSNVCDMRNNKMGHFCVVSTFIFLVKKMFDSQHKTFARSTFYIEALISFQMKFLKESVWCFIGFTICSLSTDVFASVSNIMVLFDKQTGLT